MHGLYPIIDVETCAAHGLHPCDVARALLPLNPPLLQLRSKRQGPRDVLSTLRELVALTRGTATLVFANDRPDLALMAGCDGVHLGQEDVPIEAVRAIAKDLRVGLSSHTPAELQAALAHAPYYVAYGPVFTTRTKRDAEPCVGVEGLSRARSLSQAAGVPLVAIGGISAETLPAVAPHSDLVSVISALMAPSAQLVTERARQLGALFNESAGPR